MDSNINEVQARAMPSLFRESGKALKAFFIYLYLMVENMMFTCTSCLAIYEILFILKKIVNQCLIICRLDENIFNTCLYCLGRVSMFFPVFLFLSVESYERAKFD